MFLKQSSRFETVTLYIYNEAAYLPTQMRYDTEDAVDGEPVYICNLDQDEIVKVVERILNTQQTRLPHPESMIDIYKNASNVILRATKERSWMRLAKKCKVYMVTWRQEDIIISASQLDKKGRFEFPDSLLRIYSKNMPLVELVKKILSDYKSSYQCKINE